jgi:hypothetical protein
VSCEAVLVRDLSVSVAIQKAETLNLTLQIGALSEIEHPLTDEELTALPICSIALFVVNMLQSLSSHSFAHAMSVRFQCI